MGVKKNLNRKWAQISVRPAILVGLFLWQCIYAAPTPSPSPPEMEVVFLGTGGPRPAGRAASCNLILIRGRARLLVDAGSGHRTTYALGIMKAQRAASQSRVWDDSDSVSRPYRQENGYEGGARFMLNTTQAVLPLTLKSAHVQNLVIAHGRAC